MCIKIKFGNQKQVQVCVLKCANYFTFFWEEFKGIVSQDEYFFEDPKNQNSIIRMTADGFQNF
jgi:hypothetical protein